MASSWLPVPPTAASPTESVLARDGASSRRLRSPLLGRRRSPIAWPLVAAAAAGPPAAPPVLANGVRAWLTWLASLRVHGAWAGRGAVVRAAAYCPWAASR